MNINPDDNYLNIYFIYEDSKVPEAITMQQVTMVVSHVQINYWILVIR